MSTLRTIRAHPSAVLLAGQLLAVLVYPFLGTSTAGRALLGAVGTVLVIVALYAVRRTPALAWIAVLLGVPALACNLLEIVWTGNEGLLLASALLHAPFYFYVSYGMIRYLFHDEKVTRDELFATGAAFTVVAWGFAYLFQAVQVLAPGSFIGVGADHQGTWFELLFLSFTNLTSVGSLRHRPGAAPRAVAGDGRAGRGRALRRAGGRPDGGADRHPPREPALTGAQASQPSGRWRTGSFATTSRYDSSTASSSSSSGIAPPRARSFQPDRPR